ICLFSLVFIACLPLIAAGKTVTERELINDNHFQQGFVLWETPPGKHVQYGQLSGITNAPPVWGLSQWSSRFPLAANAGTTLADGSIVWSNDAKTVTVSPPRS